MVETIQAQGKFVVIEPAETSKVLISSEYSTTFRVVSFGRECENCTLFNDVPGVHIGDIVVVVPHSVEKVHIKSKELSYVRESDIVAVVGTDAGNKAQE